MSGNGAGTFNRGSNNGTQRCSVCGRLRQKANIAANRGFADAVCEDCFEKAGDQNLVADGVWTCKKFQESYGEHSEYCDCKESTVDEQVEQEAPVAGETIPTQVVKDVIEAKKMVARYAQYVKYAAKPENKVKAENKAKYEAELARWQEILQVAQAEWERAKADDAFLLATSTPEFKAAVAKAKAPRTQGGFYSEHYNSYPNGELIQLNDPVQVFGSIYDGFIGVVEAFKNTKDTDGYTVVVSGPADQHLRFRPEELRRR